MGNNFSGNQQMIPICLKNNSNGAKKKIKGRVVLTKKSGFDASNSVLDRVHELFGKRVSIQLISATHGDPANGDKGKMGKPAYLEKWTKTITSISSDGEAFFHISFDWDETMGVPGAFIIKNNHHSQFYIKSMRLDHVPGYGAVHFDCNSWVYPAHRYAYDRIFFSNKAYLPGKTPEMLCHYREQELINLRGNGSGVLREWDRVYDYAFYNDLGLPDKGIRYTRPVLGGSEEYPYPRRGRTGRPPTISGQDFNLMYNFAYSMDV